MSRLTAGRASIWSAIDIGGRQAVQFVVSMVLARILTPADFGAITLMLFFASFGTSVLQTVIATALIRNRETTVAQESIAFWWTIGISALLGGLLVISGPALSRFYHLPMLAPLMIAAAVQVIAAAPGVVPVAILTRAMRFPEIAVAGTIANVVSGATGITFALYGFGVWALAAQLVLAAALGSALYWYRSGWLPTRDVRPGAARELFRFAGWMLPSNLLELLYSQGFALIVGRLHGPRDLGLFNRASNLQQIPQNVIAQVIGRVSLPLLAQRSGDREALQRGLLGANRLVMIFYVPLMVGMAACPRLVIGVLFGPQWLAAAPLLTILALAGLPYPVQMINLQLLLAKGEASRFLRVELTRKGLAVACVVIGSVISLAGLAWSLFAASLIGLAVVSRPTGRDIGCGLWTQLHDLASIMVAAAGMAMIVMLVQRLVLMPPLAELGLVAAVGAASYAGLCVLLRVRALGEALHLARHMRSGIVAA